MKRSYSKLLSLFVALGIVPFCYGFQQTAPRGRGSLRIFSSEGADESEDLLLAKGFLKENYPAFSVILEKNDAVWKSIGASDGQGFTIFAPNANAFSALGEDKMGQLLDPRNLETTEKVGAYHIISEIVTKDQLFNSGGVITLGGEVAVDRSVSGGMFGVGGKEDGGVLVNGAKIVATFDVGTGVLHEVDGLVSPNILWRYMDQLRIPGSG